VTYPDDPYRQPYDQPRPQPRFIPAGSEPASVPTQSLRYAPQPPISAPPAPARSAPARPAAAEPARSHRSEPPTPASGVRRIGLTAAGKFWYVLGCIAFGGAYFAKVPAKKALADFGLAELTAAETFWYVLMCIAFGAGYLAKLPTAKALSELEQFKVASRPQLEQAHGY
jgi:hypothetical protein